MKVINNTNKNITLINNKVIKKYDSVFIEEADEQLMNQINSLVKSGLLRVEN